MFNYLRGLLSGTKFGIYNIALWNCDQGPSYFPRIGAGQIELLELNKILTTSLSAHVEIARSSKNPSWKY